MPPYMSYAQSYLCRIPKASHRRQQNPTTTAQIRAMLIIMVMMLLMMMMMKGRSNKQEAHKLLQMLHTDYTAGPVIN